jgi:hypothetical protein
LSEWQRWAYPAEKAYLSIKAEIVRYSMISISDWWIDATFNILNKVLQRYCTEAGNLVNDVR